MGKQQKQSTNEKAKRKVEPMKRVLVCKLDDNFSPKEEQGFIMYSSKPDFTDAQVVPFEIREARLKKNRQELNAARRAYTKNYMKKPHVLEKLKQKHASEEYKKAKKEYSQKESTKQLKRRNAARNRRLRRRLKESNPELYDRMMSQVVEEMEHEEVEHETFTQQGSEEAHGSE